MIAPRLLGWCLAVLPMQGPTQVRSIQLDARSSHPFNRITAIHELPDGRVVVVDVNDEQVLLVDFSRSTVAPLGRKGSGPGEYRVPRGLLRLGGDSIGIRDIGNKRILVVTSSGKFGGILGSFGTRVSDTKPTVPGTDPTESDALGRLYGDAGSRFVAYDALPDSGPIVRWRVGATTRDTVAYLPYLPKEFRVARPGEGEHALATDPDFTVGSEGQIAIVHVEPYRVELIDTKGTRIKGKPIGYDRIRVSEEHKRLWREAQQRPVPMIMMTPGGKVSVDLRTIPIQEPVHWPTYLPPFANHAARFAPDGMLWIHRNVPLGQPEVFDLIDQHAMLIGQVTAPSGSRVVGFGKAHVYMARVDPDDQEFLERYTLPARGKP